MSYLKVEIVPYGSAEIDTNYIDTDQDIYDQFADELDLDPDGEEKEALEEADYEILSHDGFISHFVNSLWLDVEGFAEARDSGIDEDAIAAYMELFDDWDKNDFYDRYEGRFAHGEDYAQHVMEEEVPDHLQFYIDWSLVWRDMSGDIVEENDHYFRA